MAVFWPFCPPFECRFSQKVINDEPILKSVDCGTPGRLEVSQIRLIFAPMQITSKHSTKYRYQHLYVITTAATTIMWM